MIMNHADWMIRFIERIRHSLDRSDLEIYLSSVYPGCPLYAMSQVLANLKTLKLTPLGA